MQKGHSSLLSKIKGLHGSDHLGPMMGDQDGHFQFENVMLPRLWVWHDFGILGGSWQRNKERSNGS
jgi:hypothetical protein